ncbi:MAG: hypothetical protein ABR540_14780 [Acidimicrobiales bacterium]
MSRPVPVDGNVDVDDDDTEVEIDLAMLDADVNAALDYLCAHAGDWPDGREVAACISRHRRRSLAADARRSAG